MIKNSARTTLLQKSFIKISNASWPRKLLLSSLFGFATGYAAQVKCFLPWTPVPITLQTFVVLAAGIFLGKYWGALSQLLYIGCGAFGVPFFAGMAGGFSVLAGPRGGYLIGFVLTAFVVGVMTKHGRALTGIPRDANYVGPRDERPKIKNFFITFLTLTTIYTLLIYGPGLLQLGFWLSLTKGAAPSCYSLFTMGMFPFIPGDLIKLFLATILVKQK